jgi:predicted metalloprotease
MGKAIGGTLLAIVGIVVVFVLLFGLQIAGIRLGGVLNQEQQNANRHANQQSQAYVETKQEDILSLVRQYNDPNATDGQKAAVAASVCMDASLIQPGDYPATAVGFIAANCP